MRILKSLAPITNASNLNYSFLENGCRYRSLKFLELDGRFNFATSLAEYREFTDYTNNCCSFCNNSITYHRFRKFTGRFLHLERSSEEALVMAIKLYYIIYGSCRFNGWDSYLSIDSVLGLGWLFIK